MEEKQDNWQQDRKTYLLIALACFALGVYFLIRVSSDSYIMKPSDFKTIENLVTATKPVFRETKGKNSRQWIEFKCMGNKSTFEITYFDYRCVIDGEVLKEINAGDTISIKILKEDIEDFDAETKCEIHSLVKNKKDYLDIDCRNQHDTNDTKLGYLVLFTISATTGILYAIRKKPKVFDTVDLPFVIGLLMLVLVVVLSRIL